MNNKTNVKQEKKGDEQENNRKERKRKEIQKNLDLKKIFKLPLTQLFS